MANVVRDPREHPDAIIPDLKTNNVAPFTLDQVAFVYGSKWKQRYFTRIGDDYYPLPVQWDIGNKTWRPYHVADTGADWWTAYYPSSNLERPTGPTCDGCHSVNYDIRAKKPSEWNVGCETCHGPGSAHVAQPSRANIFNPSQADAIASTDTCIQCHSQGQPRGGLIDGKAYDWPVGYHVGLRLQDYWKLEPHTLGETSFTHYADGTAHKNRMQGNDFVQSVMYRRGVTCASCHDAHGTENYAQLRKPAATICLDCHAPNSSQWPACRHDSKITRIMRRRKPGQPMRGLPHAEDRADHRQRQRAQPHVQVHHASDERTAQDSQRVHRLSHGSVERVGHRGTEGMDRDIAMASGTMRWWRALCVVWPLLFVGPASAQAQERGALLQVHLRAGMEVRADVYD